MASSGVMPDKKISKSKGTKNIKDTKATRATSAALTLPSATTLTQQSPPQQSPPQIDLTQKENPAAPSAFVILSPPKSSDKRDSKPARVINFTQALASPSLKYITIHNGHVTRIEPQAKVVVSLFKQFKGEFDRAYRIAFKRLQFFAKTAPYRMDDMIHQATRLALGEEKGIYRLRLLLKKPEREDLSTGPLSPFGYKDIVSWPGVFELGYAINPETGEGEIFTTPAYQWVRPLHTYPKDDGLVTKDQLVYEIRKPILVWKYLLNRLHQGDMAKPLKEILLIAQKKFSDLIQGPRDKTAADIVFADAMVTAILDKEEYKVTFTFPRRALSRDDVMGIFPQDSLYGYEKTPIRLISRDKALFFEFTSQTNKVEIKTTEKKM